MDKAVNLFTKLLGFSLIVNRNSKMAVLENGNNFVLVIWDRNWTTMKYAWISGEFLHRILSKGWTSSLDLYEKLKTEADLQFPSESKKIRNTFGFFLFFEKLLIEISADPLKDNIAQYSWPTVRRPLNSDHTNKNYDHYFREDYS